MNEHPWPGHPVNQPGDPLTGKQAEALRQIVLLTEEHGYPPTMRELGDALGVSSSSTTYAHVMALVTKGYLDPMPAESKNRTLRVTGSTFQVNLPDEIADLLDLPRSQRVIIEGNVVIVDTGPR